MSHPSDAKRAALRSCDNIMKKIVINNLCPIELYYGTADELLEAFLSAYECVNFDEAYVLGMRFASFLRSLLLTRNNYRSSKRNLRQIETLFPLSLEDYCGIYTTISKIADLVFLYIVVNIPQ